MHGGKLREIIGNKAGKTGERTGEHWENDDF